MLRIRSCLTLWTAMWLLGCAGKASDNQGTGEQAGTVAQSTGGVPTSGTQVTGLGGTPSYTTVVHTGGAASTGGVVSSGGALAASGGFSALGGAMGTGGFAPATGGAASGGRTSSTGGVTQAVGGATSCAAAVVNQVVDAGPSCGDGIVESGSGETCDDGNRIGGDGCSANCRVEPSWNCPLACSPCVPLVVCGNAVRQTGEGCDDGNTHSGDGCSATCGVETGWLCSPSDFNDPSSKSSCSKIASCGDGRVTPGEQCDLGSANGHDQGCDANCGVQSGWIC